MKGKFVITLSLVPSVVILVQIHASVSTSIFKLLTDEPAANEDQVTQSNLVDSDLISSTRNEQPVETSAHRDISSVGKLLAFKQMSQENSHINRFKNKRDGKMRSLFTWIVNDSRFNFRGRVTSLSPGSGFFSICQRSLSRSLSLCTGHGVCHLITRQWGRGGERGKNKERKAKRSSRSSSRSGECFSLQTHVSRPSHTVVGVWRLSPRNSPFLSLSLSLQLFYSPHVSLCLSVSLLAPLLLSVHENLHVFSHS